MIWFFAWNSLGEISLPLTMKLLCKTGESDFPYLSIYQCCNRQSDYDELVNRLWDEFRVMVPLETR
jgi:hypothetical protein